jgi:hypothetical protein
VDETEQEPVPVAMRVNLAERQAWAEIFLHVLQGKKYEVALFSRQGENKYVEMEGDAYSRQIIKFQRSIKPDVSLYFYIEIPALVEFPSLLGLTHFGIISGSDRTFIRLSFHRKILCEIKNDQTMNVIFSEEKAV